MKFNKTMLALAVASVAAAPMSVLAAGHSVVVSGGAGVEYITGDTEEGDDNEDVLAVDDFTVNVAASTTTNSGLEAYANVRADSGFGSGWTADNNHVGIRGGFGDIRLGEVVDPIHHAQLAGDAYRDSGTDFAGSQAIGYTNTFGPLMLAVAYTPAGNNTNNEDGDSEAGTAIGLQASFGDLTVGVANHNTDNAFGNIEQALQAGSGGTTSNNGTSMVGISYAFGDFTFAYHTQDDDGETGNNYKVSWSSGDWGVNYALHQHDAVDDADGEDGTRLNVDYNLGGGASLNLRVNGGTGVANADTDSAALDELDTTRILYSVSF